MSHAKPRLNEVMTFGEHLEALRWHLIRALIGVALCMAVCLLLGQSLLDFLLDPIRRVLDAHQAGALVVRTLMEGLAVFFQISLIGGLVLASPWVFYQFWGFISPGLYPHEKQLVYRSVPILLGLFLGGAFFGWYVALPPAVEFMVRFNLAMGFQLQITVSSWIAFALIFPIAFGAAFELPLVMVLLARIGLVRGAAFRRHRRLAIVIAAVLSAVLTPGTDPISMLLMLGPLVGLYEAGIWSVWLAEHHTARRANSVPRTPSSDDLFASWLFPLLASQLIRTSRRRASANV